MSKLIILDGNSIASRAFYATPPLTNKAGTPTNAVFGFTNMLLRLIREEQPTHFLVAFDAGKITFRHEGYTEYKGGRAKTPPELSIQFPLIKELLDAFSIQRFELEGYEADDIIGTLTKAADEQGQEVLVVTGDKDMLQLASDKVSIALTRKGISEVERYDPKEIQEKYGLTPQQIIDLKGLMGDSSDNIPGIPGVGEKTALKLLAEYGSVEAVLENADALTGKMKEKVRDNAESARMSKKLATIFREVPMELDWEQLKYEGYEGSALKSMFQQLEFKSLLEKMDFGSPDGVSASSTAQASEQLDVTVVVTADDVQKLMDAVKHSPDGTAVHVEVIGENPHGAEIIGLSVFTTAKAEEQDGLAFYVPFAKLTDAVGEPIRQYLEDGSQLKLMYDAHKAQVALHWQGISLRGIAFCSLLAAYLIDPTEADHTLNGLAEKYGLPALPSDEQVFGKGAKFHVPETNVTADLLGRKALAVSRLVPIQKEQLDKVEMNRLYYELELPLSGVLAVMELRGIHVDAADLKNYGKELSEHISRLEQQIYSLAGTEFNINSPKQLGEILFEKLGLPAWKKTKTGYSTDAEVLEKLAPYHEIVANILHYRQLAKLQSTYVEGLLKEINGRTGKVHTYYRQTIAATGRLSSQFPNLQNIPVRMEEGKKIRKVFVPSEEGWLILAADYSQIELRVLAHIAGDEKMKEAFISDMDIHTKTAMDVFGVSNEQVDSNMRRQAKAVNFGIVYGISDYGLSQNLNITRKEAAEFIEQYLAAFEGVRRYMEDIVQKARQDGFVSTLLQRRRYLADITASNFNKRSFAERTAMNTPIQGTAADIIKLAMVQIEERMRKEKLKSRMLLQVHDELVFEVPPEELELMKKLVPEIMEGALALDVPLKVDVSYGTNWYEAK
ncbi:DNA polymerase I [Paenibacillus turpanensis]|uniref:DNA polymerase I n=1 Tax=Paenibacillus turpanensis TaxID=2689078 RepID=UPI00140C3776|nr:DNA polymerase I [Paenibacillus turpanensis]